MEPDPTPIQSPAQTLIPNPMFINGYRCMWVLAMFDLPTDTKKARREYTLFVKRCYATVLHRCSIPCTLGIAPSKENAEAHLARIKHHLPPDGEVRMVTITDKQFERMQIFWGKIRKPPEPAPCQLSLF